MHTEVVYVCTDDRYPELAASLRSLIESRTAFDSVAVYRVDAGDETWTSSDPRITVRNVGPLCGDYFFANKLYLCDSDADRVVFLDTDTLVLQPLDTLWTDSDAAFRARYGRLNYSPDWGTTVWQRTFESIGVPVIPMFNAGVLVFQHQTHRLIRNTWAEFIGRYLDSTWQPPFPDWRMPEQFALSPALSVHGVTYSPLSSREHGFGWEPDVWRSCETGALDRESFVVLHTSHHLFRDYYRKLMPGAESSQPDSASGAHEPLSRQAAVHDRK
jgi:hypothetical protein